MKTYETLLVTISRRVATVALNRTEMRNAFHPTMIRELTEAFAELAKNSGLSAIVLKGEGKSFCSGADLAYMKSMAGFTFDENRQDSERLFEMFWTLRSCPHPIVAQVHGHAMGGALGLIAVCDVVAAVTGTQFCFSEVKLGLAPAVISPFVLERMSVSHARRYMLSGEIFDTQAALTSDLIHFQGDEAQVQAFVASLLKTFSQNGPEAVRATKALLRNLSETSDWKKRRELTTQTIAERRVSEEGQEGLKGFLEKRAPKWKPADGGQ